MTVACGGPERCCDDLCRGQDYGICGEPSAQILCIDLGIHSPECEADHEYNDYGWDDEDAP